MSWRFTLGRERSRGSVLLGLGLIVGGIVGLSWNESRTIEQTRTLAEGQSLAATATGGRMIAEHNGKPVHVVGLPEMDGLASDPEFGLDIETIALRRKVEMYQWREKRKSDDGTTRYSYRANWSEHPIDSSSFHNTSYTNPPMPAIRSATFYPRETRIGEYRLGNAVLASIDGLSLIHPKGFDSNNVDGLNFQVQGSFLQSGQRSVPKVGDIRVSWHSAPPGPYTALAGQSGNNLIAWRASNQGEIAALVPGEFTLDQMFDREFTENAKLAWSFRLLFAGLIIAGCVAIVDRLTSFIPFFGEFFGWLLKPVAVSVGLAISLVTIAIAWLAVRPILSLCLIGGALMAVAAIHVLKKSRPADATRNSDLLASPPPQAG